MDQKLTCPRCGERFSAALEGFADQFTCPMCGAEITRIQVDDSVDPEADFNFRVDEHVLAKQWTERLKKKTLGPMIGLVALSALSLYAGLQQSVLVVLGKANGMVDPALADSSAEGRNFGIAVSTFAITGAAAVILAGAICLHTRRFYPVALAGCILASIPCLSPCVLVGMPFGIWGLMLLFNEDVKRKFV